MSFWDVLSAMGSIALILVILAFTYYAVRWYAGKMKATGMGQHIKIVDRAALGNGASLAIIEVQGSFYLVGHSEKHIQLLCTLEDFSPGAQPVPGTAASFESIFRQFAGKIQKKDEGTAHEKNHT